VSVTVRDAAGHAATASANYTITDVGPTDRPFIPYSAGAFLKSKAAGAPIDEARTAQMHTFMSTFVDQKGHLYPSIKGTGGNLWGTAYAMSSAADPIWKFAPSGVPTQLQPQLCQTGFHAPANFASYITGTSDSPFCVIDRASGITVFGTKASVNATTRVLTCQTGAAMWHSSNGLDRRDPASDNTKNQTSRGRISEALAIRRDLVDYGIKNNTDLGHVLHLFIAESGSGHCHPMVGDEGTRGGFGVEGERLIIRPDIDLTKRGLSPAGLVIARTLQNYGCYIGDNAGGESTLKAETEFPGHMVWNGLLTNDSLKGITWADFACVKLGWQ
jgi:hypothetical protein